MSLATPAHTHATHVHREERVREERRWRRRWKEDKVKERREREPSATSSRDAAGLMGVGERERGKDVRERDAKREIERRKNRRHPTPGDQTLARLLREDQPRASLTIGVLASTDGRRTQRYRQTGRQTGDRQAREQATHRQEGSCSNSASLLPASSPSLSSASLLSFFHADTNCNSHADRK